MDANSTKHWTAANTPAYARFMGEVVDRDTTAVEKLLRTALEKARTSASTGVTTVELSLALAELLGFKGDAGEARELIRDVLAQAPGNRRARMWNAFFGFPLGDPWPEAWRELASSFRSTEGDIPADRIWDGSPLNGRSIAVFRQLGLGDQIQFLPFVQLLKSAGAGRVIVAASKALIPLFRKAGGVDEVVTAEELNRMGKEASAYDTGVFSMALPGLLGITPVTLPRTIPFLQVDSDRVSAARSVIEGEPRPVLNVGICWRTSDSLRSISAEMMISRLSVSGVRLFGVVEGPQAVFECTECGITNLGSSEIEGTAAAIEALDLVISVDTMVVHLAGSLGRPVWTLLREAVEWRWPLSGDSTIWYPSMRLFRRQGGNWETLLDEVALELNRLVGSRS